MTLEEAYIRYRPWAVKKVRVWLHMSADVPFYVAEDIVQDAFESMLRSGLADADVEYPAALVKRVCRWSFGKWMTAETRGCRDARVTRSLDELLAHDPELDWPCPRTDTAASALALVDIRDGLGAISPAFWRALLRSALTPMPMGRERKTADTMATRARRRLRERETAA